VKVPSSAAALGVDNRRHNECKDKRLEATAIRIRRPTSRRHDHFRTGRAAERFRIKGVDTDHGGALNAVSLIDKALSDARLNCATS
jgi:hypothetical protein